MLSRATPKDTYAYISFAFVYKHLIKKEENDANL